MSINTHIANVSKNVNENWWLCKVYFASKSNSQSVSNADADFYSSSEKNILKLNNRIRNFNLSWIKD